MLPVTAKITPWRGKPTVHSAFAGYKANTGKNTVLSDFAVAAKITPRQGETQHTQCFGWLQYKNLRRSGVLHHKRAKNTVSSGNRCTHCFRRRTAAGCLILPGTVRYTSPKTERLLYVVKIAVRCVFPGAPHCVMLSGDSATIHCQTQKKHCA